MINHSKFRYFTGLLFLLVLLGIYYLFGGFWSEKPYEVLSPEVYEKGTTVSLYKNVPPSFPKEFILSNTTLDYSGEVKSPTGTTQTKVAFISSDSILNIINSYRTYLPEENWLVSVESLSESVGVIRATKDDQDVIVSIITINPTENMVTVQYSK